MLNLKRALLGDMADMTPLERALYMSRQGILNSLGIASSTLFALSTRQLRAGANPLTTLRRASDSKTTKIGLRPNVAYDAPRNLLHYDPVTWAEWTIDTVSIVGGIAKWSSGGNMYVLANIKPNARYLFLFKHAGNSPQFFFGGGGAGNAAFSDTQYALVTGYNKAVLTARPDAGRVVYLQSYVSGSTPTTEVSDVRCYELPSGSQISTDADTMTADQLAAKYPMVGASGASLTAKPGKPKSRVCNEFANGDGRYGTIGWAPGIATLSALQHGARFTGTGGSISAVCYFANGSVGAQKPYPITATRKHFLKVKISRPADSTAVYIETQNGTTTKSVNVSAQVAAGQTAWVKVAITQTDLGSAGAVGIYAYALFADAATQNGKTLDVEYCSISIMGDSAADPHYNDDAATYDAWLRTQPGAIPTPDGEYYLTPYGLQAGESCLDCAVAFGGTGQLYASAEEGQADPADNASQSTAASQPKWYDNGLWYPGGLFDGSDDYEVADLPDITTGPCTWVWRGINQSTANARAFSIMGAGTAETQYDFVWDDANARWAFTLTSGNQAVMPAPKNTEIIVAFAWNGTTITPYCVQGGVLTTGVSVSNSATLTSRSNKFIGCRSNAADGSSRATFLKGTKRGILIVPKALTPAEILKLW